jgi:hypothetical protein
LQVQSPEFKSQSCQKKIFNGGGGVNEPGQLSQLSDTELTVTYSFGPWAPGSALGGTAAPS